MNLPQDIQLLIKEYSMPIYRKCSHYKAYINAPAHCVLKYNLKTTPYKLGDVKLAGSCIFDDLCRGMLLPITYYEETYYGDNDNWSMVIYDDTNLISTF